MRYLLALVTLCTSLSAATITVFDTPCYIEDPDNHSLTLGWVLAAYADHLGIIPTQNDFKTLDQSFLTRFQSARRNLVGCMEQVYEDLQNDPENPELWLRLEAQCGILGDLHQQLETEPHTDKDYSEFNYPPLQLHLLARALHATHGGKLVAAWVFGDPKDWWDEPALIPLPIDAVMSQLEEAETAGDLTFDNLWLRNAFWQYLEDLRLGPSISEIGDPPQIVG